MLRVSEGVYQVKVPVPFPLKFVNCYLAQGPEGWDLLDTGMTYEPALEVWRQAFAELGITRGNLRSIFVTHIHADHYGLARWFQESYDAPVYMLDRELEQLDLWEDPYRLPTNLSALFQRHGMPPEQLEGVIAAMMDIFHKMGGKPRDTFALREGDLVPFGARSCRVIWTPGHSDGMFCLFDESDGLFFPADHILPKITPNVSLWPESRPDPLADYLTSLDKVRDLPASQVWPCHGPQVENLRTRADEIRVHHHERLQIMLDAAAGGRTAYEVSVAVFRDNLTLHELRFAMAETLAHLEYLANQGALAREHHNGRILYVPC